MEYVIEFFVRQENEIGNVVLDEMEILVAREVANVRGVARDQVVDRDDAMAFRQQPIDQVRTQKTRATSDDGNGIRFFLGHAVFYLPAGTQICQKELAG
jgi:hypothetical protein